MLAIAVEELDLSDVKLLAVDGECLTSEMVCSRCAAGPQQPTEDLVTSTHASGSLQGALGTHLQIFQQRGWRRLEGLVTCPTCVAQACAQV